MFVVIIDVVPVVGVTPVFVVVGVVPVVTGLVVPVEGCVVVVSVGVVVGSIYKSPKKSSIPLQAVSEASKDMPNNIDKVFFNFIIKTSIPNLY